MVRGLFPTCRVFIPAGVEGEGQSGHRSGRTGEENLNEERQDREQG